MSKELIIKDVIITEHSDKPNANNIVFPYELLKGQPTKIVPLYKSFNNDRVTEIPIGDMSLSFLDGDTERSTVVMGDIKIVDEEVINLIQSDHPIFATCTGRGKLDSEGVTVTEYKLESVWLATNHANTDMKPINEYVMFLKEDKKEKN